MARQFLRHIRFPALDSELFDQTSKSGGHFGKIAGRSLRFPGTVRGSLGGPGRPAMLRVKSADPPAASATLRVISFGGCALLFDSGGDRRRHFHLITVRIVEKIPASEIL